MRPQCHVSILLVVLCLQNALGYQGYYADDVPVEPKQSRPTNQGASIPLNEGREVRPSRPNNVNPRPATKPQPPRSQYNAKQVVPVKESGPNRPVAREPVKKLPSYSGQSGNAPNQKKDYREYANKYTNGPIPRGESPKRADEFQGTGKHKLREKNNGRAPNQVEGGGYKSELHRIMLRVSRWFLQRLRQLAKKLVKAGIRQVKIMIFNGLENVSPTLQKLLSMIQVFRAPEGEPLADWVENKLPDHENISSYLDEKEETFNDMIEIAASTAETTTENLLNILKFVMTKADITPSTVVKKVLEISEEYVNKFGSIVAYVTKLLVDKSQTLVENWEVKADEISKTTSSADEGIRGKIKATALGLLGSVAKKGLALLYPGIDFMESIGIKAQSQIEQISVKIQNYIEEEAPNLDAKVEGQVLSLLHSGVEQLETVFRGLLGS